jgi:hypothetical protein
VLAVVDAEKYKRGESVRHTSRLENPSALLDLEFSGRPVVSFSTGGTCDHSQ